MIHVQSTLKSVIRLGKREETKSGPIKVVMKSMEERSLIIGNLGRLKNAPVELKQINMADDYTAEGRQIIKNKVNEARNKTEAEGNGIYVYKVCGTPKNGLILKRFKKLQEETQ